MGRLERGHFSTRGIETLHPRLSKEVADPRSLANSLQLVAAARVLRQGYTWYLQRKFAPAEQQRPLSDEVKAELLKIIPWLCITEMEAVLQAGGFRQFRHSFTCKFKVEVRGRTGKTRTERWKLGAGFFGITKTPIDKKNGLITPREYGGDYCDLVKNELSKAVITLTLDGVTDPNNKIADIQCVKIVEEIFRNCLSDFISKKLGIKIDGSGAEFRVSMQRAGNFEWNEAEVREFILEHLHPQLRDLSQERGIISRATGVFAVHTYKMVFVARWGDAKWALVQTPRNQSLIAQVTPDNFTTALDMPTIGLSLQAASKLNQDADTTRERKAGLVRVSYRQKFNPDSKTGVGVIGYSGDLAKHTEFYATPWDYKRDLSVAYTDGLDQLCALLDIPQPWVYVAAAYRDLSLVSLNNISHFINPGNILAIGALSRALNEQMPLGCEVRGGLDDATTTFCGGKNFRVPNSCYPPDLIAQAMAELPYVKDEAEARVEEFYKILESLFG